MIGHSKLISITDMGPRPHKKVERGETEGGTECRSFLEKDFTAIYSALYLNCLLNLYVD